MDYFCDAVIRQDPEFTESLLLNSMFAKLHRAFCERDKGDIGVSFPSADKTLGSVLRLHGSYAALEQLMSTNWHHGLTDYIVFSELSEVPSKCQYQEVRRVQVKSNIERLMRRSIAKGWLSEAEAHERIADAKEVRVKLPYLQLKSQSTGQTFRLFLRLGKAVDVATTGDFNSYGLSQKATIPYF